MRKRMFMFTVLLFCLPLVVVSQVKDHYGVIKYFVTEDPNLFSVAKNFDRSKRGSDHNIIYTFKLQTTDGRLIDLEESIDWSVYVNRAVYFRGNIVSTKDGREVLQADLKSLVALQEPFYEEGTTTPPVTQGLLKMLAVVVTIQEPFTTSKTESIISLEQALAPIYTAQKSARTFYREASGYVYDPDLNRMRGRLEIVGLLNQTEGDATAVTITSAITNCAQQRTTTWPALVDAQLRLQGFEPNSYNATMFIYQDIPGCNPPSSASFGTIGQLNSRQYIFTDVNMILSWRSEHMVAHELGHNLALSHSDAYVCSDFSNIPASCTLVPYGDDYCVMGTEYVMFNVYQLRRLGWNHQPFKQLSFSGNYKVYSPTLRASSGAKRLMSCQFCYIPLSGGLAGNSLYYESRVNERLFDFVPWTSLLLSYKKGVKLIIGDDDLVLFYAKPFLLDTSPMDGTTYNSPLLLQSLTIAGVTTTHTTVTSVQSGSGITVSLP